MSSEFGLRVRVFLGFRVWGLGSRVWGLGFKVHQDSVQFSLNLTAFGVQDEHEILEFIVEDCGIRL